MIIPSENHRKSEILSKYKLIYGISLHIRIYVNFLSHNSAVPKTLFFYLRFNEDFLLVFDKNSFLIQVFRFSPKNDKKIIYYFYVIYFVVLNLLN